MISEFLNSINYPQENLLKSDRNKKLAEERFTKYFLQKIRQTPLPKRQRVLQQLIIHAECRAFFFSLKALDFLFKVALEHWIEIQQKQITLSSIKKTAINVSLAIISNVVNPFSQTHFEKKKNEKISLPLEILQLIEEYIPQSHISNNVRPLIDILGYPENAPLFWVKIASKQGIPVTDIVSCETVDALSSLIEEENIQALVALCPSLPKGEKFLKTIGSYSLIEQAQQIEEWMIKDSQIQNMKELQISYRVLKQFPRVICGLRQLRKIQMSHTQIKKLPQEISQLAHLTFLDATKSCLSEIPSSISQLKKLCPSLDVLIV